MNFHTDNAEDYTNDILKFIRDFREESRFCDVVLEAASAENEVQQFPVHKLVMAAASPYFAAMFVSSMRESTQNTIFIEGIEANILRTVIAYAYNEDLNVEEDQVFQLLIASDMFQISSLFKECCNFLEHDHLKPESCLVVRAIASVRQCINLYNKCTACARANFEQIILQDEYLYLSSSELIDLISSDTLCVKTEEKVFSAVLKWVYHDLEGRKEEFPEIMGQVRLAFVSQDYLLDSVEQEPLVKSNEQCLTYVQEAYNYKNSKEKYQLYGYRPQFRPRKIFGIDDMIITVGGMSKGVTSCTILERYDSKSDKWTTLGELQEPRLAACACIHNGNVYVVGGFNEIQGNLKLMERYNIKENVWETMKPMKESRAYHSSCIHYGLIYVTGGENSDRVLSSVECYNPDSDSWVELCAMNSARMDHGMTTVLGCVFAVGGHIGESILGSVESYDPLQDSWTLVRQMSVPRFGMGVTSLEGTIYVVGGNNGNLFIGNVESYDMEKDEWTSCVPINIPRSNLGLVSHKGTLYACGGFDNKILKIVERYTPDSEVWTYCSNMNQEKMLFGIISTCASPHEPFYSFFS